MIIFKKMFAEKILRFHEAMNRFSELLMRMPHLGDKIRNQIEENDNYRLKMTFGVIAQIGIVLFELLRKFLYVGFFVYLPYRIIAHFCPLIASHRELTMIFLFFMLSTICGSLANTTLMSMGDRDYLMIRITLISPYMNFLGKIVYKIAPDLVYFTIILTIFGIPFGHSLALSIVTASLRPVGEMIAIIMFDKIKAIYNNRGIYNGLVMALCVIIAYGVPVFQRKLSSEWMSVVHPGFVIFMVLIGAGASFFLWWYKHYRKIMREAMYIKREM